MNDRLGQMAKTVEDRLIRFFDSEYPLLSTGIFPAPLSTSLVDQVRELTLRGGKRIRAGLIICGANLYEENSDRKPAVIDAAAAMELMHTYFLIHDDIMDNDPMRRGGPSVHYALADEFRSAKMGRDLAILAGDLACSLQEILIAGMEIESSRRQKAAHLFSQMHMDVVHGQTLDLTCTEAPEEIVLRKTASYTTVGPLCIGGALAGATHDKLISLSRIARPVGLAFQYRDDLIGMFGTPKATGKPRGSDLKNGKRTLLIQETLKFATPQQAESLHQAFGNPDANQEQVDNALAVIIETGAKEKCERHIDELTKQAANWIQDESFLDSGKGFLLWLVERLSRRNT